MAGKVIFLKGRKVILRPLRKETDLESITRWINDPEVRIFLHATFPRTFAGEAAWLDDLGKNPNDIVLGIETLGGKLIGTMGLHNIDWPNRTAATGALIGEKDFWGKGYGTDAKVILLDYAFNTLNLRKVCSTVISYNKRSLRYSLHCGYKIEGRRKNQFFKNGRYWDELILAVFKKDWLPVWKGYRETGKVK